jgi:hypothetical protein
MARNTAEYDTPTIEVPLKWILNEPIKVDESITYEDDPETIASVAEIFNLVRDEIDYEAEFLTYHGWLDVLVFRSRVTKNFLGAYLLIERDEYTAESEEEMERMVANVLVRFTVCETTY